MNELFNKMGVSIERVSELSDGHNWEQAVEAMAEQVANYTNPSQAVTHSIGGSFWYDAFQIMSFKNINAMLSTPSTWAINFAGTGVMNVLQTQEKYLAAMYTKLQKGLGIPTHGAVTFDEANLYAYGKIQALLESAWFSDAKVFKRSALGTGMDSFVTGKTPRGPHAHELSQQGLVINDQTIGNTRWGVPDVLSSGLANKYLSKIDPRLQLRDNGALANLLDTASVATSIPGRILLSQDASFRNITFFYVFLV